MSYLKIGSGDTTKLLSGVKTKGYADLWRKFLSEDSPYYNAFASPIDALRTGAILEDVYLNQKTDDFCVAQHKSTCIDYDILTSSLDFSWFRGGDVSFFKELKTIWLTDFIEVIRPISSLGQLEQTDAIKKAFKNNYNQVQFQLNCTGLDSASLVFLSVDSYDDEHNRQRVIGDNEVIEFHIQRDEEVISMINKRASYFQTVKNHLLG